MIAWQITHYQFDRFKSMMHLDEKIAAINNREVYGNGDRDFKMNRSHAACQNDDLTWKIKDETAHFSCSHDARFCPRFIYAKSLECMQCKFKKLSPLSVRVDTKKHGHWIVNVMFQFN